MGSILKRQKLSEEQYGDRISNLPNSLIAQILSRLPTKYAVSTSVLSKRWRDLWTSITNFDFDDRLFLCPQNKSTDPSMQRSFTSFVNRVLLHHASCVEKFRLKCSESSDTSLVNGWIAYTLLRNVRELDLGFYMDYMRVEHLPQDLFTCRTLVVLKLGMGIHLMNTPVSLPSLRILRLSHVVFVDDDSINRFLFGCPVLEELSMSECVGGNVSMNIVAPRLTSFSISKCLFLRTSLASKCKIMLHTPALLYLTIHDLAEERRYSVVENLLHLIRADIVLCDSRYSAKALINLIKAISSVQFLQLAFTSEDLCLSHKLLPKFPNLTCLELRSGLTWEFLLELLENSPHLETLVFKEDIGAYCETFTQLLRISARNVPSCLLFHLKVIEFRDFGGCTKEWEMVDYFLQNMKVLEKVNICYRNGGPKWTIHASRT